MMNKPDPTRPIPVSDSPFSATFHDADPRRTNAWADDAEKRTKAVSLLLLLGYEWSIDRQQWLWTPQVEIRRKDTEPEFHEVYRHAATIMFDLGYRWDGTKWEPPKATTTAAPADPVKTVMSQARSHLLTGEQDAKLKDSTCWPVMAEPGYDHLLSVLLNAYEQAARGKGKERHANGRAFEDQPIHVISELLGTTDGQAFQAIKKIQEAQRLPRDRAIRELYGAIVYVAAIIIARETYLDDNTDKET